MNKYYKWVKDFAMRRFKKENIKSIKHTNEFGVLGETCIELNNGDKYIGYFHYQKETIEVTKLLEKTHG
ncbi:MAG: hypothetical protein ACRDD7_17170 [Peptostreptococcaceae bacterium]